MNSLNLTLLETSPRYEGTCISFKLQVANQGNTRLLLPYPTLVDLKFRNLSTSDEATWYTHLFVSSTGSAYALESRSVREFPLDVRCDEALDDKKRYHADEYYRWYLDAPPGEYSVAYHFKVDDDFFDPDSHWRFDQLTTSAAEHSAVPWKGSLVSNSISVIRK